MKYNLHFLILFILAFACESANDKTQNQNIEDEIVKTSSILNLTDSNKLVNKLDSLPKVKFPFLSEFFNRNFDVTINLSAFKNRKLFNIPLKKIPVSSAGIIDGEDSDSIFDLTDENYIAKWNLIAKTPKFIVIEVYNGGAKFVTLTYDLQVIDAINSGMADPASNNHWQFNRHSIINKDLSILIQHEYNVQIDEEYNYDTEIQEEEWFINKNGYFTKKSKNQSSE